MARYDQTIPPGMRAAASALAVVLAAAGCSKPAAPQKSAAAPAAVQAKADSVRDDQFPSGTCAVTITGALQLSFSALPSPSVFHTDYWWSEATLRAAFAAQAAQDRDVAPQDEAWWVDQKMATDPIVSPLLISCVAREGGVTIVPGRASQYADVPFAPRAYELSPGPGPEDVIKGHFAAMVYLFEGGTSQRWVVSKPGVLTISEFDLEHISGTFSFVAIGAGKREIAVKGAFAFRKPSAG